MRSRRSGQPQRRGAAGLCSHTGSREGDHLYRDHGTALGLLCSQERLSPSSSSSVGLGTPGLCTSPLPGPPPRAGPFLWLRDLWQALLVSVFAPREQHHTPRPPWRRTPSAPGTCRSLLLGYRALSAKAGTCCSHSRLGGHSRESVLFRASDSM